MKPAEILTIILFMLLLIISGFLNEIGIFQFLYLHINLAIVILLSYRNKYGIIFAGVVLVFGDLLLGLPVGIGLLSVSITGFILSLINRIWLILRSQPFWFARIIWLLVSLLIFQIFIWGNLITTEVTVIAKIILVNFIVLILVSLLANKTIGKVRYADIIIK